MFKHAVLATVVALGAALPLAARAESNVTTGAGAISATARVSFSITIPRFLFLQVGTGTLLVNDPTVDTIAFAPAVGTVGTGTTINGTGGDLGTGRVTVRLLANGGSVTMRALSSTPTLVNGSGDTIPWTQILVASTGPNSPPINGAVLSYPASGGVVNTAGSWTYAYANSVTPAAGTYTGTVTYTASMP